MGVALEQLPGDRRRPRAWVWHWSSYLEIGDAPGHGGGAGAVVVAGTVRVVGDDAGRVLLTEDLDGD